MPRFFIIDQSLCNAAGHHFDYTRNLSLAAADRQYLTVIGANRSFVDSDPADVDPRNFAAESVRSCFTNTTYCRLSELHGLRSLTRSPQPPRLGSQNDGWLARRRYKKHSRLREKYATQFYLDCKSFFGDRKFAAEDQVFFVTVSELECEGLARFLAETPSAQLASWHLQFHFELFPPAATPIDASRWIENIKPLFRDMRDRFVDRVFFYTTSVGLTQQYNSLDSFHFETLAYPVNAGFFEHRAAKHPKTQVACFGGIRREKGLKTLVPKLVESFKTDRVAQDKIELVVQGKPVEISPKARDSKVIRWVPLPAVNYVDLVHEADIGLLYYDRETFANRVSSTLNEFLCAGKPVIVSSGSWLHQKVLSPIAEYQRSMFERSKVVWSSENFDTAVGFLESVTVPLDGFESKHRLITIKVSADVMLRTLGVATTPETTFGPGASALPIIVTVTSSSKGQVIATKTEVLSHCHNTEQDQTLFVCCSDVSVEADQVQLMFSLVGEDAAVELSQLAPLEIGVLDSDHAIPTSQVGIALASEEDVFDAIKHISEHLDHFRRTASEFSLRIQDSHRPTATFEQLLQRSDLRRL